MIVLNKTILNNEAFEHFERIRRLLCSSEEGVTVGKMMSSPAIHYNKKVFAFFSSKDKMVFKLGKDYPRDQMDVTFKEFSPFKNKKPLAGWYEVDYSYLPKWEPLAREALGLIVKK